MTNPIFLTAKPRLSFPAMRRVFFAKPEIVDLSQTFVVTQKDINCASANDVLTGQKQTKECGKPGLSKKGLTRLL